MRLSYSLSIKSTVQIPGGLISFTFAFLFMQNILNEKPGGHLFCFNCQVSPETVPSQRALAIT